MQTVCGTAEKKLCRPVLHMVKKVKYDIIKPYFSEENTKKRIGGGFMISIRSARPDDAPRLLEIYSYYVRNTAISFEYEVPGEDEFRGRIEKTLEKYPYLVLEEDGVIEGYCYAGVFKARAAYDRSCEVSIYVDRARRGRGFGGMLYRELEKELPKLGITNLYACIADPVVPDEYLDRSSELFHGRMGYVKVGEFHGCGMKFGRLYNMIWMEKILAVN